MHSGQISLAKKNAEINFASLVHQNRKVLGVCQEDVFVFFSLRFGFSFLYIYL